MTHHDASPDALGAWVRGLGDDHREAKSATRPGDRVPLRGCVADAAEILARFGDGPLEWAIRVGDLVAESIRRSLPPFQHSGVAEPLRDGVRSGALRLLLDIADGGRRGLWTPEAIAADRCFLENGLDLSTVRKGVRASVLVFTEAFVGAAARLVAAEHRAEETCRVVSVVVNSFEVFTAQIEERFSLEQELVVQTKAARLQVAVSKLLDGPSSPADGLDAFGYPLRARHLAAIVWAAQSGAAGETVRRAAADLVAAAGGRSSLQLIHTDDRLWLWIADPARLDDFFSLELPPATHAACGRVLSGHDGFRSAHRQAEAAARFMTARNRGRVSNFADVALASLLEQNREAADEFIRDELGPLAEDTEDMRTLRRTVARYLAEHRSPRRAAAGLYVNRNTIIYRIRKAEKLLGRPVEERRLELETALLLMDGRDGNAASSLASGPRTGPTGQ